MGVRKGSWTEEEDILLRKCIEKYGEGKWHQVPSRAGLNRCRKSCRLRWLNYLRPNIKRGDFASDEVDLIMRLHKLLGNRWSLIAGRLPGRTANDIKNYWNSHIQKKLLFAQQERSRDKASTTTNIVKPQPWTFSRNNLNKLPLIPTPKLPKPAQNMSTNENKSPNNSCTTSSATTEASECDTQFWNRLLDSTGIGEEERNLSSLLTQDLSLELSQGMDPIQEHGQNDLFSGDFGVDEDFWSILFSDI